MPVIDVKLLSGRTADQKEALASAITEATCKALGIQSTNVIVILHDVPDESWMSAGTMMSARKPSK